MVGDTMICNPQCAKNYLSFAELIEFLIIYHVHDILVFFILIICVFLAFRESIRVNFKVRAYKVLLKVDRIDYNLRLTINEVSRLIRRI